MEINNIPQYDPYTGEINPFYGELTERLNPSSSKPTKEELREQYKSLIIQIEKLEEKRKEIFSKLQANSKL